MVFLVIKPSKFTYNKNGKPFKYKHKDPRNNKAIANHFSKEIKKNDEFVNAIKATTKDEFYTWILRNSGSFYATKTKTYQEVGSLILIC